MKKIIFQMSVSLDGYVEGPNRQLDWHIVDDEFNEFAVETLEAAEVLIMGRTTYELMAGFWPYAGDEHAPVRDLMNNKPKLVFSSKLKETPWQNSHLAMESITENVSRLKQSPGDGLLWVGGSTLAASFLDLGLMDEIRFIVTPILLGGGLTAFDGITARHPLKLVSTRIFNSGNVLLAYEPIGK